LRNTVDDTNTDRNRDVQKYVKPYKMYSHSSSEPFNSWKSDTVQAGGGEGQRVCSFPNSMLP